MTEAKPTEPRRIDEIASGLGLSEREYEPYGWYKAKLVMDAVMARSPRPGARIIGVTAITPTPLGEGKTVTSIGLAMALARIGESAIATLREPSLAPVFGIKGGGAGGGRAALLPLTDVNLHFTGDLHAIAAATNLLAALVDNHAGRGLEPKLAPDDITWRRVVDVSDRGLREITTGKGERLAPQRETGFMLPAASEVMAILALAKDLRDLRARLDRMVVGFAAGGAPVTAKDVGGVGALAALLKDAIRPNLAQTSEHTPVLVHAGPFANIAHGNSSVAADLAAVRLADYVVTESGFGADCGAEKFFHIKARASGLYPHLEVLVCTARALKLHSGRFDVRPGRPLPPALLAEDLDALAAGLPNLEAHIDILRELGVPVVVAVNRFPDDHPRELARIREAALAAGAVAAAESEVYLKGGEGGVELARAVVGACQAESAPRTFYDLELPIEEKLGVIARRVYGGDGVELSPLAREQAERFTALGYGALPVCVAKTQYSISHDPALLGRPRGFTVPIRELRLSAGAGFLYALAGGIHTMPGLPASPAALRIDVDDAGNITGLF
ncbi:MAG: formate--tetrahydrofolate ligase [Sorangiineae bacterium]|nr:formate--tetrahydrofolate ligase [Polyangiaceae bacterium]MEB2322155.1 formate--tetrahydrofolate ligase [Sorangiineae bacterium]